ncbi:MAG: histidine phosphatase family protein [Planctomycetota bacterium]
MQLFLIRHAQSENNARSQSQRIDDPALTRIGHEQAKRLARRATELRLTRIYTSPFLRTLQTARHLQHATGLAPQVRVPLHEKGGCIAGTSTREYVGAPGMTRPQISKQFPGYRIPPEINGEGWWGGKPMETSDEAVKRANSVLHAACQEFGDSDERIAYVMHGDFLLLLLGCFHPAPLNVAWNASLSSVSIRGGTLALEEYACVNHLPNYLVTW